MDFWHGLTWFLMFIPILAFHEAAHAWTAHLCGDDTAKDRGRMTLNPASHIDPIGTLLIPGVSIFLLSGFALIGWGKPVPVDPRNFRRPVRDDIFVALAGPASNIIFATAALLLGNLLLPESSSFRVLIWEFSFLSVFLAVFNLIPIPPLDGWHPFKHLFSIPEETALQYGTLWLILLLVLINLPPFMNGLIEITLRLLAVLTTVTFYRFPPEALMM